MTGWSGVNRLSKIASASPCGCSEGGCSAIRSTTFTTRTSKSGTCRRSMSTAARVSIVGTSPAQAITTSGSCPASLLAHGHSPAPAAQCRTAASMIEPLQRRLLARDDHVHVIPAAQAVVDDRKQRVRIRRQIDPHDGGLLVRNMADEAGILMAEPVMVLPPDMRAKQILRLGDRPPPRDVQARFEPLGVLVEHRIDDVDERFVAVEQPVPPGQQVALEPALAEMLAQHLHDPAIGPPRSSRRQDFAPCSRASSPRTPRRAGCTRFRRGRTGGNWSCWPPSRRAGNRRARAWLSASTARDASTSIA